MASETVLVPVMADTLAKLLRLRTSRDEAMQEVFARAISALRQQTNGGPRPTRRLPTHQRAGKCVLELLGERFVAPTLKDAQVTGLRELAKLDGGFLSRLAAHGGRTRRYVARRREEVYPTRPDLARRFTCEVIPGWWTGTNHSRADVERILRTASDVAGLIFGQDLKIEFRDSRGDTAPYRKARIMKRSVRD